MSSTAQTLVVTGGTGFIGGAVAAALAQDPDLRIVLPCRDRHDPEQIRSDWLGEQAVMLDLPWTPSQADRIHVAPHANLLTALPTKVDSVVHCAASLDYADRAQAESVNIELTGALLDWAGRSGCRRFVHISTAFAAGLIDSCIPEGPLHEPEVDANCYTRTKRQAERLVADSGLNWSIIRPAVVIGDARHGRYCGRPHGLYQLLEAIRRIPESQLYDTWHLALPDTALPAVHIDRVVRVIQAAIAADPVVPYINVVPDGTGRFGMRDLFNTALQRIADPPRIHWHPFGNRLPADVPIGFKMLARLLKNNLAIIGRDWQWQTGAESRLLGPVGSDHDRVTALIRCVYWYLNLPEHHFTGGSR